MGMPRPPSLPPASPQPVFRLNWPTLSQYEEGTTKAGSLESLRIPRGNAPQAFADLPAETVRGS